MKKVIILLFIVSIIFYGCSKDDNFSTPYNTTSQDQQPMLKVATAVVWDNLSQAQKDDQIMNTAYLDNGKDVKIQCKPWVSKIVLAATSNHVTVPSTKSNQYEWNSDPSGHIVGRSTMIENVKRADIIQMYIHLSSGLWTPHTAVVVSKDANGMNWIDSNWVGVNIVGVHYISFSSFYTMASNRYTVYHVQ